MKFGTGPAIALAFAFASAAQATQVELANVTQLSARGDHACVLTNAGGVKCWGSNTSGELGSGTAGPGVFRRAATDVAGLTSGAVHVAAALGPHSCAIVTGGGVKCWGSNEQGQLGDGTTTQRLAPVDVQGLPWVPIALSAGQVHTCALSAGGAVACWGDNRNGQLGDGTLVSSATALPVPGLASGVLVISAGRAHTCAILSGGAAKCWGRNTTGELGDGTTTRRTTPVDVLGLASGVTAIDAAGSSGTSNYEPPYYFGLPSVGRTCAIASGVSKCWGGGLGPTPTDVAGMAASASAISWGGGVFTARGMLNDRSHGCVVTVAGGVRCWGSNWCGMIGDGTPADCSPESSPALPPTDVVGLSSGVVSVSAASLHSCALQADGHVKCWGYRYGSAPVDAMEGTSPQATIFVNAGTGTDSGPCTAPATPCKTVAWGMNWAAGGSPGDEIHVASGTYDKTLGETFPIVVKSGVLLKSTSGAERTFLDASGTGKRVIHMLGLNGDTVIEGFTITGGAPFISVGPPYDPIGHAYGGGMHISGGSPTIRGNVFLNNRSRGGTYGGEGRGGAIHVANATPLIVNNVFRGNRALGQTGCCLGVHYPHSGGPGTGGAIYLEGTGGAISNNTFYLNAAIGSDGAKTVAPVTFGPGGSASHGAVYSNGASVSNNIFASNFAEGGRAGAGEGAQASASFGALQALNPPTPVSNNLFFSNTVNGAPSTGDTFGTASVCTSGTPCSGVHFHGEPSNLRITPQSPAAGAGTATGAPADDFDGVTRPNPPSIGAFEPSAATGPVRLVNISTRAEVLTGNDVMIGGFIIGGSTAKTVVVRARGPSLLASGLTGFLVDPTLQLYSGQTIVRSNDDWQQSMDAAQIQASGFAPLDPRESAIMVNLNPGPYTAIVSGAGGTTGIGIVEVFEVDAVTTQLINLATRGDVLTGDKVMIAGFIIQGTGPQTVVVRARGPSLAQFGILGVLRNPTLQLFSGQTQLAVNDDWQSASNATQLQASGFAPADPLESAILITLQPGAYTAIVTGAGGTTGVAIVEVFKN